MKKFAICFFNLRKIGVLCMVKYFLLLLFSVAKKKSLFNDKPHEIQQLTFIIKQDINSLNKQIAQLQEVCGK